MVWPQDSYPEGVNYSGTNQKYAWWNASNDQDVAAKIWSTVNQIVGMQKTRRAAYLHFLRLYSNRYTTSISASAFTEGMDVNGERIRLNVGKSAVDSSLAFMATNQPRPLYDTEGGNFELQQTAANRGKFVTGLFYRLKQYLLSLQVYLDAAVFGDGYEYVFPTPWGTIGTERWLPDEVLVDDNDGRDGRPMLLYRLKEIPRSRAIDTWPEYSEQLRTAERMQILPFGPTSYQQTMDPITLIQAWKLPTHADANPPGQYVLCGHNFCIEHVPWKRDHFPVAHLGWNFAPLGFYNIGAIEEISPVQVEVNFIAQKLQRFMTLLTIMGWKKKGTFVGEINNQDMAMREFVGEAPVFRSPAQINAEWFAHLKWLFQIGYDLTGIPQMQASGRIPAGLESGEAVRMVNDVGAKRGQAISQRYEQFHLDVGELMLEAAEDLMSSDREVNLSVLTAGDKDMKKLLYSDIRMPVDDFVLRAEPISPLSDSAPGKVETFQKMAQIVPDLAPWMLKMTAGIPDLDHAVSLVTAPIDYIEKSMDAILLKGSYIPPDAHIPLQMARDVAQRYLLRARLDGVKPDRLEMIERYIEDVDALQEEAQTMMEQQAAAQSMAASGPGGPGAGAGPGAPSMPQVPAVNAPINIQNQVPAEISMPGLGGAPVGS